MTEEPIKEQPRSYVFIEFEQTGSVVLRANFENVTPLQIIAAAEYISIKAKNELIAQENARMMREAEQSVARPKPGILIPNKS